MATGSAVDEKRATFCKELVELLQEHNEIQLVRLQELYQRRFKRNITVKHYGVASMKKLLALFEDKIRTRSMDGQKFLTLNRSAVRPQTVQPVHSGAAGVQEWHSEFDGIESEPDPPLSPQTWAGQGDLRTDLILLVQSSPKEQVKLARLADAYKERYGARLDLDAPSLEALVNSLSDVLEVACDCHNLKHMTIRNKSPAADARPDVSYAADSENNILRQELVDLLRAYPNGLPFSMLNKKYGLVYHKALCKKAAIYKKFKDDFEFVCKVDQVVRMKTGVKFAVPLSSPVSSAALPRYSPADNVHPGAWAGIIDGGPPASNPFPTPVTSSGLLGYAPPCPLPLPLPLPQPQPLPLLGQGMGVPGYAHTGFPYCDPQRQTVRPSVHAIQGPLVGPNAATGSQPQTKKLESLMDITHQMKSHKENAKEKKNAKEKQSEPKKANPHKQKPHGVPDSEEAVRKTKATEIAQQMMMVERPKSTSAGKQQQEQKKQQLQTKQPLQQQPHAERRPKVVEQRPFVEQHSSCQDRSLGQVNAVAQDIIANVAEAGELVTQDRVVDLLKQRFGVQSLRVLGVQRANQIEALDQLERLQARVNACTQAFVRTRAIGTLHELRSFLATVDAPPGSTEKQDFSSLQLGPLAKQPLVYEYFKFPPTKEDKDILKITTVDILEVLNQYLTAKNLWRTKVKLDKFTEYVTEKYGVESPYDLGLRIRSLGLGISALKKAQHEQAASMNEARQAMKTSLEEEVDETMRKIRKAVMSPADIAGHTFPQPELRRRYVDMTAVQVLNRLFCNAEDLLDCSRPGRQFCKAVQQVAADPLSRSLVQLAICIGDLSRPTDLPEENDKKQDRTEESSQEEEEELNAIPASQQPPADHVKEELLRYLKRLLHGSFQLTDLARIEQKLCQHFGFSDFPALHCNRMTFLQFLSTECSEDLKNFGGALMSLVSPPSDQSSLYRPSRLDLVEFIQQCNPQKESLAKTDFCLCSHYQVKCVEELGHGPLASLCQRILSQDSTGYTQGQNAVLYETALCTQSRQTADKQKEVGLLGPQSLESALACLASAPLLEDLSEWSHWPLVFEPEHGNLKAFLESNPGQDVSPPIELSALEVQPGVLLRLATEACPDLFAEAAKAGNSVSTAGHLVSLVAKAGLAGTPLALLASHMEEALNVLAATGPPDPAATTTGYCTPADAEREGQTRLIQFALDCLLRIPQRIGQAVVRQVILGPLTAVLGSEAKVRQLLLGACQGEAQRTKLQRLGLLLGINEWKASFAQCRVRDPVQEEEEEEEDDEDGDDLDIGPDTLGAVTQKPTNRQTSPLEAGAEAELLAPMEVCHRESLSQGEQVDSGEAVAEADELTVVEDARKELDPRADGGERQEQCEMGEDSQSPGVVMSASADAPPDAPPNVEFSAPTDVPPDATLNALPNAPPDALPDAPPDAPPDVLPDALPDALPGAPPDVPPDAPPDAPSDAPPDAPSGAPPDDPPDAPPSTAPDALPDAAIALDPKLEATLLPFHASVLRCQRVVEGIRREEFSVGVALDVAASQMKKRDRARMARMLERLAAELYTKDVHFVLELIQNADDNEYGDGVQPTLVFQVDRSAVTVLNNECGFSESNVRALCDVGKTTKGKHKRGYIGHKGIGFKSVFRVTDRPEIMSNGYHVCFDRIADEMGYICPTWVGPKDIGGITQMEEPPKPWTTTIRLPLNRDFQKTGSLVNKFEDIQPSLLLFLNRLKKLVIENKEDKTTRTMARIDRGGNLIEIRHNKSTDRWLVIKKCLDATKLGKRDVESTELGLAFPLTERIYQQDIFAFLPLGGYGFHFIIQGDFDIPSSRHSLDMDSAWNQWLMQEIAPLFLEALECFKAHFSEDLIKATEWFLRFVPLEDQILRDFRPVAMGIQQKLKASPCMPALAKDGRDEVIWSLPSKTVMCKDPQVREIVSSSVLWTHLGCSYLHQQLVDSTNATLLKGLGVKDLQTDQLISILSSVASTSQQSGDQLDPTTVARWLSCIYTSRSHAYDVSVAPLERMRGLPIMPLASGQVVALGEGPVFFPVSAGGLTGQSAGRRQPDSASRPFKSLEQDLSTLDGRVLTSLDNVANLHISRLLEELGVRHLVPAEVINQHILPTLRSDAWQEKPPEVLVEYAVYIKEHWQRQPTAIDLEEVGRLLPLLTAGHGFVRPGQRPVHFTPNYGNPYNLSVTLPGYDWTLLHSCYLVHRGQEAARAQQQGWKEFCQGLGVLNFLAVESRVRQFTLEEMSNTPWAEVSKHWPKPADGTYKVRDYACPEFEALVQAKLEAAVLQQQQQNLLRHLQAEWQDNYSRYCSAKVQDGSGQELVPDTHSSFAAALKTSPWLPSSPVSRETAGDNAPAVVFRTPAEVFVRSTMAANLLRDHVPYLNAPGGDRSGLLQFLGVRTDEVISAPFMVSRLKAWCSDGQEGSPDPKGRTLFHTSLDHVKCVYGYLRDSCSPRDLRELFSDHRAVFVTQPGETQSTAGGFFVHKLQVYWHDPSQLLGKYGGLLSDRVQLLGLYPPEMEDFFCQQLNVDKRPTITEYAKLLVHCAGDIALPDSGRIREEILVLYSLLGQKCVATSMAEFVKQTLRDEAVFPTVHGKWVTLADRPLICPSHSGNLYQLFQDQKAVHIVDFGDRDRLGRAVGGAGPSVEDERYINVFLRTCGVEQLSDCVREEFVTELTMPSLPLQLLLHDICPYLHLYFLTHGATAAAPSGSSQAQFQVQAAYQKLTDEVNIRAKLRVMQFMQAGRIEKLHRLQQPNHQEEEEEAGGRSIFARESVECALRDWRELYVAKRVIEASDLRRSSPVRREVAKTFAGGSQELQGLLFNFLGSLLLELDSRRAKAKVKAKAEDPSQGLDKGVCKNLGLCFPPDPHVELWSVPKPLIPEEVVAKPVKASGPLVESKRPQPPTASLPEKKEEEEGAEEGPQIYSWPPKSSAVGPHAPARGGQMSKEDSILEKWPMPKPLDNHQSALASPERQPQPQPQPHSQPQPPLQVVQRDSSEVAIWEGDTPTGAPNPRARKKVQTPTAHQDSVSDGTHSVHAQASGQALSSPVQGDEDRASAVGVPLERVAQDAAQIDRVPSDGPRDSTPSTVYAEETVEAGSDPSRPTPEVWHATAQHSRSPPRRFTLPPLRDGTGEIQVQFEELVCGQELQEPATALPANQSLDTSDVARWGEELVHLYLKSRLPSEAGEVQVHWVNQSVETGGPYDIVVTSNGRVVNYIEVKTTVEDQKRLFDISAKEVSFAVENPDSFHVYLVFNAGKASEVRLCRLQDLAHKMHTKQVKLYMLL